MTNTRNTPIEAFELAYPCGSSSTGCATGREAPASTAAATVSSASSRC
jgi:N-methylhydantoinase B/oxoprolinase/acetone carboxylase alpha subunit